MVFFSHDCAGKRGLGEFRVLLGPGSPWVPKIKLFAQLIKIPALRVTSSVHLYIFIKNDPQRSRVILS